MQNPDDVTRPFSLFVFKHTDLGGIPSRWFSDKNDYVNLEKMVPE